MNYPRPETTNPAAALDADPNVLVDRPPPSDFGSSGAPQVVQDGTATIQPSQATPQASQDRISAGSSDEENPLRRYQPLYKAALKGDWEAANSIFKKDPEALRARITSRGETALHVAINFGRAEFVENLVELMPQEALELREHWSDKTALHYATMYGSLRIVKTLVAKNGRLTQIVDRVGYMPFVTAVYYFESKEVVQYLASYIPNKLPTTSCSYFHGDIGGLLMTKLVDLHFYDICLQLLDKYPFLATATDSTGYGMLFALALSQPSEFPSGMKLGFLGNCIYRLVPVGSHHHRQRHSSSKSDLEDQRVKESLTLLQSTSSYLTKVMHWINVTFWTAIECLVPGIKHIKDEKYKHQCTQKMVEIACEQMSYWNEKMISSFLLYSNFPPLRGAARNGTIDLITSSLQYFPYLLWDGHCMLEEAVFHRQEKVFNLFLGGGATLKFSCTTYDVEAGESLMHKVARLAPYPQLSSVSCPALQMQRELQWFKAVEKLLNIRLSRNRKFESPSEIFTTEHRELLRDAERWMKDTSNSCLVVSTLIATVVFAAAFTVPGGNVDDKGIPLFLGEGVFVLFAASDALGLFSSAASIFMFLSILTARYAEEDFLRALPKRLILGFASLFLAIASMMVAFGATLCMVLSERFRWIFIPIIAVTSIPVALFAMLQLPLFIYMVQSTYGSGIFHPRSIW